MAHTTNNNMADKVFQIPKLLENILLRVDARTVLKAQQVNRTFRDTVDGSVKIKKSIGLLPDEKAGFCLPLFPPKTHSGFHGMKASFDPDLQIRKSYAGKNTWVAYLAIYISHNILRPMGTRCRSLSICQPPTAPLMTMSIREGSYLKEKRVKPQTQYLTVGDLQDAAASLLQEHSTKCQQRKRGEECLATISVAGCLELRDDDAAVKRSKRKLVRRMRWNP